MDTVEVIGLKQACVTFLFRPALDVHQAKLTVCIMYENELGEVLSETQKFGGFKNDRLAMAEWVASFKPELVVAAFL